MLTAPQPATTEWLNEVYVRYAASIAAISASTATTYVTGPRHHDSSAREDWRAAFALTKGIIERWHRNQSRKGARNALEKGTFFSLRWEWHLSEAPELGR